MNESLRTQIITALDELIGSADLTEAWATEALAAQVFLNVEGRILDPQTRDFITQVLDRHNIVGQIVDADHAVHEAIDDRCATCKHLVILRRPAIGLPFLSHTLINPFQGDLSWL